MKQKAHDITAWPKSHCSLNKSWKHLQWRQSNILSSTVWWFLGMATKRLKLETIFNNTKDFINFPWLKMIHLKQPGIHRCIFVWLNTNRLSWFPFISYSQRIQPKVSTTSMASLIVVIIDDNLVSGRPFCPPLLTTSPQINDGKSCKYFIDNYPALDQYN